MKRILKVLTVIIFVMFVFVGCAKTDNTLANSPSVGNGGLAVVKGEYVYFVNGFVSKTNEATKANKNITKGGIYRVKANQVNYSVNNGMLNFISGNISVDDDGDVIGAELIIKKVCAFENAKLYIFGEYIYYVTPSNKVDGSGEVYIDDIEFCRAKLDGKDNKVLGTITNADSEFTKGDLVFYNYGGEVYFACYNGADKLEMYKITNKSTSLMVTVSSVTEVMFSKIISDYNGLAYKSLENKIFYLTNSGKTLNYLTLGNANAVKLNEIEFSSAITLIGNNGTSIYYSHQDAGITTVYSSNLVGDFNSSVKVAVNSSQLFTNILVMNGRDEVVASDSGAIYLIKNGSVTKTVLTVNAQLIETRNEYVFYISDNKLYVVNAFDAVPVAILLSDGDTLFKDVNNFLSVSNQYVYFYVTTENGTYLKMSDYLRTSNGNPHVHQFLANQKV